MKKILVVDDDKDVADDIADILEETGKYHVLKAYSGEQALKIIEKENNGLFKLNKIKLVLLDIRMPELDGIGTLSKMLNIDEDIRAIMVTAYDIDDYWIDSVFLDGAIAYILKPYKKDDVLHKIEQFYKGRANVLKTQAMLQYTQSRNKKRYSSPSQD